MIDQERALVPEAWANDGWMLRPGFFDSSVMAAARAELTLSYPTAEQFAANPMDAENLALATDQWAGMRTFPFPGSVINRLVVDAGLVNAARALLATDDVRIYQASLWAKFGAAADYDQRLHVDYPNHTLVVPRNDPPYRQVETFLYLSDVDEGNGATRLVSRRLTRHLPLEPSNLDPIEFPEIYGAEVPAVGSAGSLLVWGPDVFHRGTRFTEASRARYVLLTSFCASASTWAGYQSWPRRAHNNEDWPRFVSESGPSELKLFGFPQPGDAYWTLDTLEGVARRYPGLDMDPWRVCMH